MDVAERVAQKRSYNIRTGQSVGARKCLASQTICRMKAKLANAPSAELAGPSTNVSFGKVQRLGRDPSKSVRVSPPARTTVGWCSISTQPTRLRPPDIRSSRKMVGRAYPTIRKSGPGSIRDHRCMTAVTETHFSREPPASGPLCRSARLPSGSPKSGRRR